jgi:hypothetical protein
MSPRKLDHKIGFRQAQVLEDDDCLEVETALRVTSKSPPKIDVRVVDKLLIDRDRNLSSDHGEVRLDLRSYAVTSKWALQQ